MLERERKMHGFTERLKYMHLLEEGGSIDSIHKEYGIYHIQLQVLWEKYKKYGLAGVKKSKYIKADLNRTLRALAAWREIRWKAFWQSNYEG